MRCDEQHDLGLLVLIVYRGEQPADNRQIDQAGESDGAVTFLVIDETSERFGLAVTQSQFGCSGACSQLIGQGSALGCHLLDNIADFKGDLDTHLAVEVHARFDVELEAHLEVADALGYADVRRRRRGDDRDFIADQDVCLFPVLHADPWIGEKVRVAEFCVGVDLGIGDADLAAVEMPQIGDRQLRCRRDRIDVGDDGPIGRHGLRRTGNNVQERELSRRLESQLREIGAAHFEHFYFEHHLRLREIVGCDQVFDEPDRSWCIAHCQTVQLFISKDVARLQDRLQEAHHLLCVRIAEVEGLDHQVLVVFLFGGKIGVNQDGIAVEVFFLQLVGQGEYPDRVLDGDVLQEHRSLQIGLDLAVEHEIDSGAARQGFEHRFDIGVVKLQGDLLAQAFFEARWNTSLRMGIIDLAAQLSRRGIVWILGEHRVDHALRLFIVLACQNLACGINLALVLAIPGDVVERLARARVGGLDVEDLLVES